MQILTLRSLLAILVISQLTACAYFPEPQRRSGPVMGAVITSGGVNRAAAQSSSISAAEARRLAVANGLTGYKPLPPGIAKNLARGKALPPGIARTRVPGGMLNSLPRIDGHEWQISGTDLVLIAIGTLIVVEVLQDVFE
jgi:hypothetical protein